MAPHDPRPISHRTRAHLGRLARALGVLLALTLPLVVPGVGHLPLGGQAATSPLIGDADLHLDAVLPQGYLEINLALTQTQNACEAPLNGQVCLRYTVALNDHALEAGYGLIPLSDVTMTGARISLSVNTAADPNLHLLVGRGGVLSITWTTSPGAVSRTARGRTSTLARASVQGTVLGHTLAGIILQAHTLTYAGP